MLAHSPRDCLEPAAEPLPDDFRRCVAEVADDFRLGTHWVNCGPRHLLNMGLPKGWRERVRQKDFGTRLRIYWLGRADLICLKLYAACDDKAKRMEVHVDDLVHLNATPGELETGVEWLRETLTPQEFSERSYALKQTLGELGHEDLAYYVV